MTDYDADRSVYKRFIVATWATHEWENSFAESADTLEEAIAVGGGHLREGPFGYQEGFDVFDCDERRYVYSSHGGGHITPEDPE